jgi:primosomal protein N' (replication factor Y)
MYANVLFPISSGPFTYKVPDELKHSVSPGCRVKASFRNRQRWGIVIDTGSAEDVGYAEGDRNITLKEISEPEGVQPLIPANMIRLLKWMSWYYLSPMGLVLKCLLPPFIIDGKRTGKARITYDDAPRSVRRIRLTGEQQRALDEIIKAEDGVFLLHGVTGSGKTEIYIRAIQALPEGKSAIVLVPEIAVTAQMIDRFHAVFGNDAVFYHSGLSAGERIDAWHRAGRGDVRVVLGVRSAVFVPAKNLGLIVVDEEQEPSYKQFEGVRYNARDVALARARIEKTRVVLGSATPSIEVYHNAKQGGFRYLRLEHRVDDRQMPDVEIIDMRKAEKESFSLSRKLVEALIENESAKRQSLIMINRRGYSPFFICTDCGYSYKCPQCSITLIYHKDTNTLNCHYCNSYLNPQSRCPKCGNTRIKYLGTGTQRVEEELRKFISGVAVSRMDRDSTRRKLSHYRIVKEMEDGKTDILLGTQMVAKGHDFRDVDLAAAISADMALNLPDFRSAERAFQLFTQLAGRAGRGDMPGRAIIQTYEPDHYAFRYIRNHDYEGFYEDEIKMRRDLSYPPFSRLIRLIFGFSARPDDGDIKKIRSATAKPVSPSVTILGPAPAPVEKIKRRWRWHVILKGTDPVMMRSAVQTILSGCRGMKGMKIDIDADPVNLL